MNISEKIQQAVAETVKKLYSIDILPEDVQVQTTKKEFAGDLTVVTFAFTKAAHKAPEQISNEIGQHLTDQGLVVGFNVVKGFLNLVIDKGHWPERLNAIVADTQFGIQQPQPDAPLMMIEYSSPNTNKPLHLGHVRNNLLGHSIAQIQQANGWRVVKTNIVNDRGIHIMKSMLAWQKWGNGCTPESTGEKGDHLIGDFYVLFDKHYKEECHVLKNKYLSEGMDAQKAEEKAKTTAPLIQEAHAMLVKWENGDAETCALWERMNQWVYAGFDETYRRLGISFDKIYYESQTYLVGKREVERGLAEGLFYRHDDGSVWANLTAEGLDEKLLLRSDGTSVYMTQDIGTAKMRYADYPIKKMVYVVGNEQNYHFQVLSLLLDKLGFEWGKDLVHFSYGMVELPHGKMKSREGTVVDADELIDEMVNTARTTAQELGKLDDYTPEEVERVAYMVGLGALKYFILKVDPRKNMLFNPAESIDFNGNTGPFIQYTYARIQSILRKAAAQNFIIEPCCPDITMSDKEVTIVQQIDTFPDVIHEAGEQFSPALIANYTYNLVKAYNQFYNDTPILREPNAAVRNMRLQLSAVVARTIRSAMQLLGIDMPDRM